MRFSVQREASLASFWYCLHVVEKSVLPIHEIASLGEYEHREGKGWRRFDRGWLNEVCRQGVPRHWYTFNHVTVGAPDKGAVSAVAKLLFLSVRRFQGC